MWFQYNHYLLEFLLRFEMTDDDDAAAAGYSSLLLSG